jgi:hypothetical protein
MNKLTRLILPTLLITIATNTVETIAQASPVISGEQLPQPIADYPRVAASLLKPSVPKISETGIRGDRYFIRIKVGGEALTRLIVSLPEQIEASEHLSVLDRNGRNIPVKVEATKQQVTLIFARPISAETTAEISFDGVQLRNDDSATLQYRVSAQTVNTSKEILVGTAKIKVPKHS